MTKYEEALKSGNLYRKRCCERCGAVTYERVTPIPASNVSDGGFGEPVEFELSGFGAVVIVSYDAEVDRREMTLCPGCAKELNRVLEKFLPQIKETLPCE